MSVAVVDVEPLANNPTWSERMARAVDIIREPVSTNSGEAARQLRIQHDKIKNLKIGLNTEVRAMMEKTLHTLSFFLVHNKEISAIMDEMEKKRKSGDVND